MSGEVSAWFFCQQRGADLHMAQLMPLPLSVSCFSKIQIGFTFLILAHPGSPGQRAVKRVCVYESDFLSFSIWQVYARDHVVSPTTDTFIHKWIEPSVLPNDFYCWINAYLHE